jgi:hypothetical protein
MCEANVTNVGRLSAPVSIIINGKTLLVPSQTGSAGRTNTVAHDFA